MKNERGQTMIEILAALAVMGIVLSAVSIAIVASLSNASFSRNQNLATEYAQQGIEIIRDYRTINFSGFVGLQGGSNQTYCLADSCSAATIGTAADCGISTSTCSGKDKGFTRQYVILSAGNSLTACGALTEVKMNVSWSDSKCSAGSSCHTVQLVDCLSNVGTVLTP